MSMPHHKCGGQGKIIFRGGPRYQIRVNKLTRKCLYPTINIPKVTNSGARRQNNGYQVGKRAGQWGSRGESAGH